MELRIFQAPSKDYDAALALRYEVLRQPLGLQFTPAELQKDWHDTHFAFFENEEVLCCLTLTNASPEGVKMRQVAVQPRLQRQGLGAALCRAAEAWATESGFRHIFCHARQTAVPFYQRLGYSMAGDLFTEVGIPHYKMVKELAAQA